VRDQAGGRLHRRCVGPEGQAHGPRRRDRVGRLGHRRGQVRRDGEGGRHHRPFSGRLGRGHRQAPGGLTAAAGLPPPCATWEAAPGRPSSCLHGRATIMLRASSPPGPEMTEPLRIAMAQFDFPVADVAGNTARIAAMIAEARDEYGADVVLFPELAVSGYPPEDLLMRPQFLADCEQALRTLADAATGIAAVVGWPESAGAVLYNSASVLRNGRIERTYRKRELPNYNVFDERRYFHVDPDGESCVFEVKGVPVGLLVCEDLWFPEPIADTVDRGAQLVLVPNASPFERGKHAQRDAMIAAHTRDTGAAIAYLNVVGGQDALVFDGSSVVADGDGTVHPAAAAFTDQWLVVDYDPGRRAFTPVLWMDDGDESMDALAWRAVVRGIRDYFGK